MILLEKLTKMAQLVAIVLPVDKHKKVVNLEG